VFELLRACRVAGLPGKGERVMTRFRYLVAIVFAVAGCDELDPDPCRDDCEWKPSFQNCSFCICQDHQRVNPKHVCCQGGSCARSNQAAPKCMFPDNGIPHIAISGLQSNPVLPLACSPLSILWEYVNQSSGELKPPAALGFEPTLLRVHEVDGTGTDETRDVPWNTIAACQREPRVEPFQEGLVPTTSTTGVFALTIERIPVPVQGNVTSILVESSGSPCPPP
jgi:hypothetical protein